LLVAGVRAAGDVHKVRERSKFRGFVLELPGVDVEDHTVTQQPSRVSRLRWHYQTFSRHHDMQSKWFGNPVETSEVRTYAQPMNISLNSLALASLVLLGCSTERPAQAPVACAGFAPAAVAVETVSAWETSRLTERTPKAARVDGVRFTIRPDAGVGRAGVERTLRCGLGPVGEVLAREGVREVEVVEAGVSLEARVKTTSPESADRLVAALAAR
jgi:hypothetical protein